MHFIAYLFTRLTVSPVISNFLVTKLNLVLMPDYLIELFSLMKTLVSHKQIVFILRSISLEFYKVFLTEYFG